MKQFSLIILLICTHLTFFGQTPNDCSQTVSGEVRDGISTDVLVGAEVVLTDSSGVIVATKTITEDGAFSFTLQCDTGYKIEGRQVDYTAESKTFTTSNEDQKVLKLIILLDKGNIDFVTEGAENAKTIDSLAKAEVDIVEIKPVIVDEEIATPETPSPVIEPVIVQQEPEKPRTVTSAVKDALTISPVYFDYESSWLNQKAKADLNNISKMMLDNPNLVLECAGHADSKGATDYNQWMSDRRVKRVIDYIVARGVSPERISGKGYGETKLVNDCTNDKECTDEERAINRRTEFRIVTK